MEGVAGLIRMAFKQLNIEPSTYGIQVKRINLSNRSILESRQMLFNDI